MDDEQMGRDADSVTGTKGAIDPETGAYGTAGTPMTTGYGVSGSTVGTGSAASQAEQEEGDFAGAMPDTKSYDGGGRGSKDTQNASTGKAHETSVVDKHGGARQDEAPVQQVSPQRDVYTGGPSYTGNTRENTPLNTRDRESGASVGQPPTYGSVSKDESRESSGTNIEGTADPRGLGDNTDDQ